MPHTHDPLVRALTGLTRITPDRDRAAAVRARCARHYAARHQPPDPRPRRGGLIVIGLAAAVYLAEISRAAVQLFRG